METQTQVSNLSGQDQNIQTGDSLANFAAAFRQFKKFGRGRSMRKFCDDEGYDYHKFCRYVRQGAYQQETTTGGFIEIDAQNLEPVSQSPAKADKTSEGIHIQEVKIRFSNGMVLSNKGCCIDDLLSLIHKIVS